MGRIGFAMKALKIFLVCFKIMNSIINGWVRKICRLLCFAFMALQDLVPIYHPCLIAENVYSKRNLLSVGFFPPIKHIKLILLKRKLLTSLVPLWS